MIERSRLVLLGHPVAQSLSPVMHNAALQAAGLTVKYEAIDVAPENFAALLAELAQENAAGNVTFPHKKAAMNAMNSYSEVAHKAGGANTFWSDGNGLPEGDNTDVAGFVAALAVDGFNPAHADAVVLGAGGSARAIAWGLVQAGVRSLTVANRLVERAEELLADLLAADLIPAVWIGDGRCRMLRRLVSRRRELVKRRTQIKERDRRGAASKSQGSQSGQRSVRQEGPGVDRRPAAAGRRAPDRRRLPAPAGLSRRRARADRRDHRSAGAR